jgi:hypothetical protein
MRLHNTGITSILSCPNNGIAAFFSRRSGEIGDFICPPILLSSSELFAWLASPLMNPPEKRRTVTKFDRY